MPSSPITKHAPLRATFFYPGDLLLFAGGNWESRAIALATCSPAQLLVGQWFSHVGICAAYRGRMLLFESTTLCDLACAIQRRAVRGPQAHEPRVRIASYQGSVWRLRLDARHRLSAADDRRLSDFLVGKLGDGYDYEGAAICGTRLLRLARWIYPSLDKLFCSAYAMGALKDAGVVDRDLNPAAYSPARMARDLQWWGTYQALGRPGGESVRLK